tara:strand:+ start:209 stop:766 length:558 start_codon:yes stop_codon:yes gene_type:complete
LATVFQCRLVASLDPPGLSLSISSSNSSSTTITQGEAALGAGVVNRTGEVAAAEVTAEVVAAVEVVATEVVVKVAAEDAVVDAAAALRAAAPVYLRRRSWKIRGRDSSRALLLPFHPGLCRKFNRRRRRRRPLQLHLLPSLRKSRRRPLPLHPSSSPLLRDRAARCSRCLHPRTLRQRQINIECV